MALCFRKMKQEDVYGFKNWGAHSDPRFFQYNFIYHTDDDLKAWYKSKQRWITRKVYALFFEDHVLGFVTLKHINWFTKSAELGIAIDPAHVSEGYGTFLLKAFLSHVFAHFPIETMTLRVAHFNTRAQKSYEKVGFVKQGEVEEPFEEQGYKELIMKHYPDLFCMRDEVLYTTFYKMAIDKVDFMLRTIE